MTTTLLTCPRCNALDKKADNAMRAEIQALARVRTLTAELKQLKKRFARLQQSYACDED